MAVSTCLSLIWGQPFALWLWFLHGYKKSCWFLIFSAFILPCIIGVMTSVFCMSQTRSRKSQKSEAPIHTFLIISYSVLLLVPAWQCAKQMSTKALLIEGNRLGPKNYFVPQTEYISSINYGTFTFNTQLYYYIIYLDNLLSCILFVRNCVNWGIQTKTGMQVSSRKWG